MEDWGSTHGENKNIYSALLERCQDRRTPGKLDVTLIGFK